MPKKIISITVLILLVSSSIVWGQRRHGRDWDDFDDIAWVDINPDATPMIEFSYGFSKFRQKKFNGDFSKIGSFELKLGYTETQELWSEPLIDRNDNFIFGAYHSSDFVSDNPLSSEFDFNVWQFGIGKREGYGFDFEPVQIIPYTQSSVVWNILKTNQTPGAPVTQDSLVMNSYLNDVGILDRYNNGVRFGNDYEAGLKVNIASFIDITGGFQFGTIYPRYMVWKQIGSFAMQTAGLALLDEFVDEIMDSSPEAGPIMNVLLKGAFNFAFYKLQQEKMSWPFNSETPLGYENFKFGVTFTF
jgi:hypothetical protein